MCACRDPGRRGGDSLPATLRRRDSPPEVLNPAPGWPAPGRCASSAFAVLHSGHDADAALFGRASDPRPASLRRAAWPATARVPSPNPPAAGRGAGGACRTMPAAASTAGTCRRAATCRTRQAQQESFSLANMVPQAPKLNRGIWEGHRERRAQARRTAKARSTSSPARSSSGAELQRVGNVIVPSHTFKAVLRRPRSGLAAAYVAKNVDSAPWAVISMAQLSDLTGLDIFPALSADAKYALMRLPAPTPHGYGQRRRGDAR